MPMVMHSIIIFVFPVKDKVNVKGPSHSTYQSTTRQETAQGSLRDVLPEIMSACDLAPGWSLIGWIDDPSSIYQCHLHSHLRNSPKMRTGLFDTLQPNEQPFWN